MLSAREDFPRVGLLNLRMTVRRGAEQSTRGRGALPGKNRGRDPRYLSELASCLSELSLYEQKPEAEQEAVPTSDSEKRRASNPSLEMFANA